MNERHKQLIPWKWVLPKFYGPRKFIAIFIRALHWSRSWARSIHSIPAHPISLRSVLLLSLHPVTILPSGLFPSVLPPESYMHFSSPLRQPHPPWLDYSNTSKNIQLLTTKSVRSKSLWRWYISTNIMFLDTIHHLQGNSYSGQVDRASPYLQNSIDWAQLSRFCLKTGTESSLRNVVFWNINRTVFWIKTGR
jgi:hypothetical protein